jgi:hypothetical protein
MEVVVVYFVFYSSTLLERIRDTIKEISNNSRGSNLALKKGKIYVFQAIGSQMTVRFSALCTSLPLLPGRFLVLISVRGCVDP